MSGGRGGVTAVLVVRPAPAAMMVVLVVMMRVRELSERRENTARRADHLEHR